MIFSSHSLITSALLFAQHHVFEREHVEQVTRLALTLFDKLRPLHKMGEEQRRLLEAAAILHDVGRVNADMDHNKRSRDLIIGSSELCGTDKEKIIIGLIARYHRGSVPQPHHSFYNELSPEEQHTVKKCSALIRIADGLDRSHEALVTDIGIQITESTVTCIFDVRRSSETDVYGVEKKSGYFEDVFAKKLIFSWRVVS